jgi:hypothetical protein
MPAGVKSASKPHDEGQTGSILAGLTSHCQHSLQDDICTASITNLRLNKLSVYFTVLLDAPLINGNILCVPFQYYVYLTALLLHQPSSG